MRSSILLALILALFILVSGCQPVLTQQTELSNSLDPIAFFSDRRTKVEYGITAGQGVRNLLLTSSDGDNAAYVAETSDAIGGFPISWSPSGDAFIASAFDSNRKRFCLMLFEGKNRHCIGEDNTVAPASWSPDGSWISFSEVGNPSSDKALYLYQVETARIEKLTAMPADSAASISTWSPDSKRLAYDITSAASDSIWMIAIGSGEPIRLTTGQQPAWSPKGNEIAFVRSGKIWLYNLSDKTEEMFIDDPVKASWPAWSPDGQHLLFQSERDGNSEVYRVNRDGSGLINLTNNPAWDGLPSWRPTPK